MGEGSGLGLLLAFLDTNLVYVGVCVCVLHHMYASDWLEKFLIVFPSSPRDASFLYVFNTYSLRNSTLLHITWFKYLFVLISLYVRITWIAAYIWWKFHVNSPIRNVFPEKNVDTFNTYFFQCKHYIMFFSEFQLLTSDK